MSDPRNKNSWFHNPNKQQVLFVVMMWFLAMICLLLAVTDLFTEPFFDGGYLMIYLIMFFSTYNVFKIVNNYLKG
jgi:membrane-associated protease RseP (regulator of RpoE activity)